jgi:hypothetical protein
VRTTQSLQPHYNVKRFLFGFWVLLFVLDSAEQALQFLHVHLIV